MRDRPAWRAPKIIRVNDRGQYVAGPAMLAKRSSFGDFSEGSGRRQCESMARSTGERCRLDAVQGSKHCRRHGGLHQISWRLKATGGQPSRARVHRKALAAMGAGEPPSDMPNDLRAWLLDYSPLRRGMAYEAWSNRQLAPDAWLNFKEWLQRVGRHREDSNRSTVQRSQQQEITSRSKSSRK